MPPDRPQAPEFPPWHLVTCPGSIRFARIRRELHTQFRIYVIFEPRAVAHPAWISQSNAELVKHLRSVGRRVHMSSLYRILRGEAKRNSHLGYAIRRCATAEDVNKVLDLAEPSLIAVVLRDADNYELATQADEP